MYDVIIAGASFAGLAVAHQLRGYRVLLLDRKPVGAGQTSACGTILRLMEYWGLEDAVLQVQNQLALHTLGRDVWYPSPYRWCTFDYSALCQMMFERSGAEFVQAAVEGVIGDQVQTLQGNFRARYIVDATGWKAVLASCVKEKTRSVGAGMNLGVESILALPKGNGLDTDALHFWYDPTILQRGIGWAFPRGDEVSIGVGSYGHTTKMRPALERMTTRLGATQNGSHGTYFPSRLQSPVVGHIFVVGDAAGMCVAMTGEGIRPAMFFGEACGRIIRQCLENGLQAEHGLRRYAEFVCSRKGFFKVFTAAQWTLSRLPIKVVDWVARTVSKEWIRSWIFDAYWGLTRPWDKDMVTSTR